MVGGERKGGDSEAVHVPRTQTGVFECALTRIGKQSGSRHPRHRMPRVGRLRCTYDQRLHNRILAAARQTRSFRRALPSSNLPVARLGYSQAALSPPAVAAFSWSSDSLRNSDKARRLVSPNRRSTVVTSRREASHVNLKVLRWPNTTRGRSNGSSACSATCACKTTPFGMCAAC